MKKIVILGGGTGTFTVLSGLRDYPFDLSAVVSMADNGGSTGILRDELGVLPPGDIRQALVALSQDGSTLRELLGYRFTEGSLKGHNFGNLFLSALEKVTGSFDKAVLEASRILAINGHVIPATTDVVHLQAETAEGKLIKGEHDIEEFIWSEQGTIQKLWLEPRCKIHPLVKQALKQADLIIIAPGSIFTSLIPNLLVEGMTEILAEVKAPLVYIANLMTENGQASDFYVQDFADTITEYLGGRELDYVVYNTKVPNKLVLEQYKKEMERKPVRLDHKRKDLPYRLMGANLLARNAAAPASSTDVLAATRTLIRHDSHKLANLLYAIMVMKDVQKYLK